MQNQKLWKLSKANLPNLTTYLASLDFSQNWEVVIRLSKSTRTLDQNRRLWDLYRSIGDYLGYTADEVHLLMGFKFLRQHKYVGDEMIEFIESTTKLNTAEMTRYQEQIELYAGQLGWGWDNEQTN